MIETIRFEHKEISDILRNSLSEKFGSNVFFYNASAGTFDLDEISEIIKRKYNDQNDRLENYDYPNISYFLSNDSKDRVLSEEQFKVILYDHLKKQDRKIVGSPRYSYRIKNGNFQDITSSQNPYWMTYDLLFEIDVDVKRVNTPKGRMMTMFKKLMNLFSFGKKTNGEIASKTADDGCVVGVDVATKSGNTAGNKLHIHENGGMEVAVTTLSQPKKSQEQKLYENLTKQLNKSKNKRKHKKLSKKIEQIEESMDRG